MQGYNTDGCRTRYLPQQALDAEQVLDVEWLDVESLVVGQALDVQPALDVGQAVVVIACFLSVCGKSLHRACG